MMCDGRKQDVTLVTDTVVVIAPEGVPDAISKYPDWYSQYPPIARRNATMNCELIPI